MSILQIPTPRVFVPLLQKARYKGARGGRGSGKSHFFAEQLVEEAVAGHVRAACLREVQISIKDSVKQLIEDKIRKLEVEHLFKSTDTEIRGPNDSLIIFRGLQNHTAASIKSLEGFNRAWVEEAQTITQKSLEILTPTFRAAGSELRFSWNPNDPSDPIEEFFNQNKGDPEFVCVDANWMDNPWFPEELKGDMERDRARDPEKYAHVWMGQYLQLSEARVFKNWRVEEFDVPPDAMIRQGADWGYSIDPSVLVQSYIIGKTMYVPYEAYMVGCEIDALPDLFRTVPDSEKWWITADSARPETIAYMQRHGFPKMGAAVKGAKSLEEGIEFLRSFDIVVHPRCTHVINELTLYSYETDPLTGRVIPKLADKNNHTIDALRYANEGARRAQKKEPKQANQHNHYHGAHGWMG